MKIPLATLFLSLFGACKKDPEDIGPCGVKNPIEELPWLKEEIGRLSRPSFTTYHTCEGKYQYAKYTRTMDEGAIS